MYGINSPQNDPQYEGSKTVHFSVIYSKGFAEVSQEVRLEILR